MFDWSYSFPLLNDEVNLQMILVFVHFLTLNLIHTSNESSQGDYHFKLSSFLFTTINLMDF